MADADEDEWEYEYDENETEDFYITVDLSNVPERVAPEVSYTLQGGRIGGNPTRLQNRLRKFNSATQTVEGQAIDSPNIQEPDIAGELQISGLNTENPLMIYDGKLLSCQWVTTIGTDLFFAASDPALENQDKPLRSLESIDLLAMSSARLVARRARFRPHDEFFESSVDEQDGAMDVDRSAEVPSRRMNTERSQAKPQRALNGTSPAVGTYTTPDPNSFIGKWNEIRARKGESRFVYQETANGGPHLIDEYEESSASDDDNEDIEIGSD